MMFRISSVQFKRENSVIVHGCCFKWYSVRQKTDFEHQATNTDRMCTVIYYRLLDIFKVGCLHYNRGGYFQYADFMIYGAVGPTASKHSGT
jgi:hypothetical protein